MGCNLSMHQTVAYSKEINNEQDKIVNLTEWERIDYQKRLKKRKKKVNLTINTDID